jgi:pimeloyl-ACP methyl ester carboxylesterase
VALELAEPDRAELVDLGRSRWRLWCWGEPAAPPVLLLHGGFDHGRMFDQLAPRLAALGHHVVAPDLRGHGDTTPADTGLTWALQITDLALLAEHLGGAVGIVAHSFGAGLAGGLAGCCPDRVRWMVCLDGLGPPADSLTAPAEGAAMREAVSRDFDKADRDLLQPKKVWGSLEEMAERRARANPRLGPDWALHLARHGARAVDGGWEWKTDPRFQAGVPSDFDVEMLEVEMRMVRCPVLVLMGTEPDTWRDLSPEVEEERAGWLSGRLVRVPDAGHYVHLEQPDLVVEEILGFVAEVGP